MNRETLSLGFVGGGWNSAVGNTHFIAARMDRIFSVNAGVFSRDQAINRQTGERWDIAENRIHATVDELLAAEAGRLDAIVVLTPTPDHAGTVIKALENGFAVICEKALATSTEEARRIAEVAQAHDGFVAVTFNYTGYPMVRELRRMIVEGRLGRIKQIHAEMPQEGYARLNAKGEPATPQSWRMHDGAIPTISLDLGDHLHNLIRFLTGERALEVLAVQATHGNFEGVVDNVMGLARYSGGIDCACWFSKSALGHRNGLRLRIYGSEGSAEWRQTEPEELILADVHGHRSTLDRGSMDARLAAEPRYTRFKAGHPAGFIEAFANLYDDIGQSLKAKHAGRPWASANVFDALESLEGLSVLEAMAASAKNRSWTAVPSNDELRLQPKP